ncbi:hypothetical protein [Nocardia cyriacigeorgica]|uniref:hypothetical protein n=1 Tax=Nocardia cyriacigeorgica TaxID=135487 RepID=UPI0018956089|nr:hypothetical protein [Nocardia cyriacigeorgica]MBF6452245.1 hypothetical protein [Nocardia cyriacigeorgica]MBF6478183.1 hypothetical protein [Nocardia cyriacigeorgica]MBF6549414.1 hypothetical protein [Nocardia cyriacigeorgica]
MESNRAKIVGPVAAAGAVSLGLVLIGACGVGSEDTYVAPPPIRSGSHAPAPVVEGTTITASKVIIPPSPTWKIAPDPGPRRTLPAHWTTEIPDEDSTDSVDEDSETTTRRPRAQRTTTTEPPATTEDWEPTSTPTTRPARTTRPLPTYEPDGADRESPDPETTTFIRPTTRPAFTELPDLPESGYPQPTPRAPHVAPTRPGEN